MAKTDLGSVKMISDENVQVVWQDRYEPFGGDEELYGSMENTYKFTGKGYDPDADLYYFNARWYDKDVGRFISEDPLWGSIFDPQSLNRFAYGRNNPYRYVDPSGMWTANADDFSGITLDHDSSLDFDSDDYPEFENWGGADSTHTDSYENCSELDREIIPGYSDGRIIDGGKKRIAITTKVIETLMGCTCLGEYHINQIGIISSLETYRVTVKCPNPDGSYNTQSFFETVAGKLVEIDLGQLKETSYVSPPSPAVGKGIVGDGGECSACPGGTGTPIVNPIRPIIGGKP